ncbi:MAG: MFS transporter [Actinomycetota bacterium]
MSPRETIADTFRSLRVRNYRLFTIAQLISLSGTWMQTLALSWLVLTLTKSGVALGIVIALQFLPTSLAGMWGGLIADRFDKRKILMWTQSLSGVLALALGALTVTGAIRLWMVYALAFLLGCVTTADTPARQAFVIEMVGRDEVANAVGLNSATFNLGRIIGPALAAIVIAAFGLATAFFLNGLSYLGPFIALRMMDGHALHRTEQAPRGPGMVRDSLRYAWGSRKIRRTLLLLIVIATIGFNFAVSLPLFAKFTFHGTPSTLALLSGLTAAGGLIGALWCAARAHPTQSLLAGSATAFGVFMIAAAFAPTVLIAGLLLLGAGAASMAFISTANSTLQLTSPAHLRGRIMALYAMVLLGSTPFGGPLVGWISERWGARAGLWIGGAASLAAALVALATVRTKRPSPSQTTEAHASTSGPVPARSG